MPVDALALEEISISPNSEFFAHYYMQHAGPRWRVTRGLHHHIYFMHGHNFLNDATVLAFARNISYQQTHSQAVTASGSVHLSSSGSERA